jgi:hypothetical protein
MYPDTPTWPDFNITVVHSKRGVEFVRAVIEDRLCNLAFADAVYIAGTLKPHYPVPAILTDVIITRDLVSICEYHAEHLSYQFICKA